MRCCWRPSDRRAHRADRGTLRGGGAAHRPRGHRRPGVRAHRPAGGDLGLSTTSDPPMSHETTVGPHRPARSAEARRPEARRPEARPPEARPPEARPTELCEAVGIGLGSNNFAELGGAGEPRGAGREMKLPRWVLSAHRRTLKNLPPAMKRKASMVLATSSSVTVLCHRMRFPAVQGFEGPRGIRSEEHTSELQSRGHLVCRLLLEKKN